MQLFPSYSLFDRAIPADAFFAYKKNMENTARKISHPQGHFFALSSPPLRFFSMSRSLPSEERAKKTRRTQRNDIDETGVRQEAKGTMLKAEC